MIIDEKMIMKRCHNLTYDYRNVDVKNKKRKSQNDCQPLISIVYWYICALYNFLFCHYTLMLPCNLCLVHMHLIC